MIHSLAVTYVHPIGELFTHLLAAKDGLPRRCAPRNDKWGRDPWPCLFVHPRRGAFHHKLQQAPFLFVPNAAKLRPSRRLQLLGGGKEASEDSTAAYGKLASLPLNAKFLAL